MNPLDLPPSSPPVITRIDSVAARTHSARSMMRASVTAAPSLSPVTSRTGSSALREDSDSCVDGLAPGVVGGGRRGPHQLGADGGGEAPVDGAPDGRRLRRAHEPHPQERRVAASASIAVRPVGPALLEMNANVRTRPLASVTKPDQRVGPGQRAGLGAEEARRSAACVGVEVAVGQRAAAARDGQQVHQRAQVGLVAARGGVDHLVERLGRQPVVDRQPAGVEQGRARRCRSLPS